MRQKVYALGFGLSVLLLAATAHASTLWIRVSIAGVA